MTEREKAVIAYKRYMRQQASQQGPLRGGIFGSTFLGQQQAVPPRPQPIPRPRKKVESVVIEPKLLT